MHCISIAALFLVGSGDRGSSEGGTLAIARPRFEDLDVDRCYHATSLCLLISQLHAESDNEYCCKTWIENRLRELDASFAVSADGFSLIDWQAASRRQDGEPAAISIDGLVVEQTLLGLLDLHNASLNFLQNSLLEFRIAFLFYPAESDGLPSNRWRRANDAAVVSRGG